MFVFDPKPSQSVQLLGCKTSLPSSSFNLPQFRTISGSTSWCSLIFGDFGASKLPICLAFWSTLKAATTWVGKWNTLMAKADHSSPFRLKRKRSQAPHSCTMTSGMAHTLQGVHVTTETHQICRKLRKTMRNKTIFSPKKTLKNRKPNRDRSRERSLCPRSQQGSPGPRLATVATFRNSLRRVLAAWRRWRLAIWRWKLRDVQNQILLEFLHELT